MWFKKPRLIGKFGDSSISLLRESFSEYGVTIAETDMGRNLKSLNMDDIDFIEAVQLVAKFVNAKIDLKGLGPTTTIAKVVAMIDEARDGSS